MFRIFKNSILKNTSWLIFEKISRMAVALFINVMVARYLGPEKFGILGYASSLLTFVGTFIYLGLSGIVVKELIQRPKEITHFRNDFYSENDRSYFGFCNSFNNTSYHKG